MYVCMHACMHACMHMRAAKASRFKLAWGAFQDQGIKAALVASQTRPDKDKGLSKLKHCAQKPQSGSLQAEAIRKSLSQVPGRKWP